MLACVVTNAIEFTIQTDLFLVVLLLNELE